MAQSTQFAPPPDLDVLADVLGDPTRRAIFVYLSESAAAATASEVGDRFGIHRTVARSHLERLVEHGLLGADFRRKPGGGRPAKLYARTEKRITLDLPFRQYEVLVDLLLGTLEQFGEAGQVLVRSMGFAFGQRLAAKAKSDDLKARVAELARSGARVDMTEDEHGVHVELRDCLFREAAERRPHLVCTLDRAIVSGLLSDRQTGYTLADAVRRTPERDVCRLTYQNDHSQREEKA